MTTEHEHDLALANDIGEVTATSWRPNRNLTFDDWHAIGNTLQQISASINWWIGDWLNYGEFIWRDRYAQAIAVTGWDYQRLADAKYIAGSVDVSLRNENLSWTHHRHVASLPPELQAFWLDTAQAQGWRSGELRAHVRASLEMYGMTIPPRLPTLVPIDEHDAADYQRAMRAVEQGALLDDVQPPAADDLPTAPPSAKRDLSVMYSSETDEHYTPKHIIAKVVELFGGRITLDPCSNSHEQPNVPAEHHFTIDDDGLALPWFGHVYVNSPYGDALPSWAHKATSEYMFNERVHEIVMLVPARVDTAWWRVLTDSRPHVCFFDGRLRFSNADTGAPFPSALVYFGEQTERFCQLFGDLGEIWRKVDTSYVGLDAVMLDGEAIDLNTLLDDIDKADDDI